MQKEYNIVLKEKPLDAGLTRSELCDLFDMLTGIEAIPIEIQGEFSTAIGFINLYDAELENYDYSALENLIRGILNDMERESKTCEYPWNTEHGSHTIWLSR